MVSSNLSQWFAIATNIGVILGLVFLGLEYRQNTELIVIERSAYTVDQNSSLVDLVVQDPSLIELLGRDPTTLSVVESDRLRLLGLRMLLNFQTQYRAAVASGGSLEAIEMTQRAIFNRPRLNYGTPHAWNTWRARGQSDFTIWFENTIIEDGD